MNIVEILLGQKTIPFNADTTKQDVINVFGEGFGYNEDYNRMEYNSVNVYFNENGLFDFLDIQFYQDGDAHGVFDLSPVHDRVAFDHSIRLEDLLLSLNYHKIAYSLSNSIGGWDFVKIKVLDNIEIVYRLDPAEIDRVSIYG